MFLQHPTALLRNLDLPYENVNDQSISRKSKNSHKEENNGEYIMRGWRLCRRVKPMRVDFLQ